MNDDRGMIKWAPFNSIINNKYLISSLVKEKAKVNMPILSDEEIADIEWQIINAYYTKNNIIITYYQEGYLLKISGKIKKIDQIYKIIYLDNHKLLFNQIININFG